MKCKACGYLNNSKKICLNCGEKLKTDKKLSLAPLNWGDEKKKADLNNKK